MTILRAYVQDATVAGVEALVFYVPAITTGKKAKSVKARPVKDIRKVWHAALKRRDQRRRNGRGTRMRRPPNAIWSWLTRRSARPRWRFMANWRRADFSSSPTQQSHGDKYAEREFS